MKYREDEIFGNVTINTNVKFSLHFAVKWNNRWPVWYLIVQQMKWLRHWLDTVVVWEYQIHLACILMIIKHRTLYAVVRVKWVDLELSHSNVFISNTKFLLQDTMGFAPLRNVDLPRFGLDSPTVSYKFSVMLWNSLLYVNIRPSLKQWKTFYPFRHSKLIPFRASRFILIASLQQKLEYLNLVSTIMPFFIQSKSFTDILLFTLFSTFSFSSSIF